jgi:hypothetical protein
MIHPKLLAIASLAVVITPMWSAAQPSSGQTADTSVSILTASVDEVAFSSSSGSKHDDSSGAPEAAHAISSTRRIALPSNRPFQSIAINPRFGSDGIGVDLATPIARRLNVRVGASLFHYKSTFQDQGANVDIRAKLQSGHANLDWFPFGGRFRVSPLVVFGDSSGIRGTVLVPAGSTITLAGADYTSSHADPLHGTASVDFRKVSPGLSIGFGDVIPRRGSHFSFPVEAGFHYVGQPQLKVSFSGSACDPSQPELIGCQSISNNADFQHSLAAFTARNNNNLKYASFLPILSVGVSYHFSRHPAVY